MSLTNTIYEIKYNNENINSMVVEFSDFWSIPMIKLGFNKNIYDIKDKYGNIVKKYGINKCHSINYYEHLIKIKEKNEYINYPKSISLVAIKYFNITNNKPKILSRAFYKLWEILIDFNDILTKNKENIICAHLAEGPGSFIQASILYREKYNPNNKDKYYGITLHSENKEVPNMDKEFIKYYSNKYINYETSKENNGDLTNPTIIKKFANTFKDKKAHFITADGGFPWTNENLQEQEAFKLILGEIITALSIQDIKGNFVCKIFDTYCLSTVKLILLCQQYYEKVYIIKPFTSRQTNSEKYLVCKNFKGITNETLNKLYEILSKANTNKKKLIDIFETNNIDKLLEQFAIINNNYFNTQYDSLSKVINIINNLNIPINDYIEANNNWVKKYFK